MSDEEWLVIGAAAFVAWLWSRKKPTPLPEPMPMGGDGSAAGSEDVGGAVKPATCCNSCAGSDSL